MKPKSTLLVFIILLVFLSGCIENQITNNTSIDETFTEINETQNKTETGFVTRVIDGDTVVADGEHIRLLGIDADERGDPCYKEAKEKLEEYILNKEVILESDNENKDQYGRLLRYIFLDGENINLKLVEEGFAIARFYPENTKYKDEIINAEKESREKKLGCKWRNI